MITTYLFHAIIAYLIFTIMYISRMFLIVFLNLSLLFLNNVETDLDKQDGYYIKKYSIHVCWKYCSVLLIWRFPLLIYYPFWAILWRSSSMEVGWISGTLSNFSLASGKMRYVWKIWTLSWNRIRASERLSDVCKIRKLNGNWTFAIGRVIYLCKIPTPSGNRVFDSEGWVVYVKYGHLVETDPRVKQQVVVIMRRSEVLSISEATLAVLG